MRQLTLGVGLRDHALFSTWHPGRNEPALRHLQALATGRDEPAVLLWGGAGVGKTHLLLALCAAADAEGRRSAYLSLRDRSLDPQVLDAWQGLDLFCADDLHCVAGDARWEAALFGLFQGLREHGATLVCTSRSSPSELGFALADLSSRLRSGPVFHLLPLGEYDLIDALRLRVARRGLELPQDTATYLLRRFPRDLASLCEVIDRLDDASLAAKRRLTVPFVREALGEGD